MAVAQEPNNYTTAEVFIMCYMVLKGNTRQDFSASITPEWPHNTLCGKMTENRTNNQPEWLSCNNHVTIQL